MDYASIQIQDYGGNWLTFQRISFVEMTGDQSRLLRIYDRVCWKQSITDVGTVIGTAWSGVTISWDDGDTASIQHNDMAQVERVATKVK